MQQHTGEPESAASGPLGRRCVTEIDARGHRWVAYQAGGNANRHGKAYLTLSLALDALHSALVELNACPEFGPAHVVVAMPEAEFLRLRDGLVEAGAAHHFKTHPSRVRIDETRRSFMLRGITVQASELSGLDLTCPQRRRNTSRAHTAG